MLCRMTMTADRPAVSVRPDAAEYGIGLSAQLVREPYKLCLGLDLSRELVQVDDLQSLFLVIFPQISFPGMETAGDEVIAVHLLLDLHLFGDLIDPADKSL